MPRVRLAATALSGLALLQLMWLASPVLPVGGFSYCEGLEAAVEGGQVPDEAGAARWLGDQLTLSLQRADLPLLASAHRAWQQPERRQMIERITDLNAWALQTRETRELRPPVSPSLSLSLSLRRLGLQPAPHRAPRDNIAAAMPHRNPPC